MGIKHVVYDSPRAAPLMKRMVNRLENLQGVAPQVHDIMRLHVFKTFESEGSYIGENWPGYTGSERVYGAIKQILLGSKRGKKLLRWAPGRERLFPSLFNPQHPEHVWRLEGKTFVFGTKVPYAHKHQKGVGRGPAWALFPKIKKRTFLKKNLKMTAKIIRAYKDYMGLGAVGARPGR